MQASLETCTVTDRKLSITKMYSFGLRGEEESGHKYKHVQRSLQDLNEWKGELSKKLSLVTRQWNYGLGISHT